jgi:hypothetical protein
MYAVYLHMDLEKQMVSNLGQELTFSVHWRTTWASRALFCGVLTRFDLIDSMA